MPQIAGAAKSSRGTIQKIVSNSNPHNQCKILLKYKLLYSGHAESLELSTILL
jgi:hypothetical protein